MLKSVERYRDKIILGKVMDEQIYEEGDLCPQCGDGHLELPEVENCTCFQVAPCSRCEGTVPCCSECGWED